MEVLRTPDERFDELARYPFAPKYAIVDADHHLRMHYVDEGRKDAPVILFLHGEPTWSYLYRHMMRMVTEAGYRAIAPDLIGFGRSDKPAAQSDYSYSAHVAWVKELIDVLGLDRIVLVCHDWGGLIGLRLVAQHPQMFARVVASNTFLPTGEKTFPDAFFRWRDLSQNLADLDVGMVIQGGCLSRLPQSVLDAYRAPFPDESFKAGVRSFPMLVPTDVDAPGAAENRLAWESLAAFERPFLVAFSDSDPITKGAEAALSERVAGAKLVDPVVIKGASHFLQEDRGSELAQAILEFLIEFPVAMPKKPEPVAEAVEEAPTVPMTAPEMPVPGLTSDEVPDEETPEGSAAAEAVPVGDSQDD